MNRKSLTFIGMIAIFSLFGMLVVQTAYLLFFPEDRCDNDAYRILGGLAFGAFTGAALHRIQNHSAS